MASEATAVKRETTEEKIERLKTEYGNSGDWTKFQVRMYFITPLCASVPASTDLVEKWLASRTPPVKPAGGRSLDEVAQEVLETLPQQEEEEVSVLVFQELEGGPVVRGATLRAHIKDCAATISSYSGKIRGEKSFAVKAKSAIYMDWQADRFIPILRHDGTRVTKDDGERTKLVHARTPRGPISAFKVFREIHNARLDFDLLVLGKNKPWIGEKDLRSIFDYGCKHGYGGERSEDGGKYVYELEKL